MLELALGDRVRVIGGARVEDASMAVATELSGGSAVPSRVATTDVLPSLVVNVKLDEVQNLRLSATQTLARPEYRELSPINGREVIAGRYFQGNPDLKRTLIQNADVRWEWYPSGAEVLSVGVFAKRFQDPIERVDLAVSGTRGLSQQQVVNADGADNYGVELELRKGLGTVAGALAPFTAFANATLMRSTIDLGNDSISAATSEDRAMAGQAPYVVNTGLTYSSAGGHTSATLLYNVVGARIVAAGANPLPNITEEPRHVLDLSLRFPVLRSLSGRVDAKNLLDAPYVLRQGTVTRERYEAGRVFSLGLTWRQ
jgi:TonB-dependent receptor